MNNYGGYERTNSNFLYRKFFTPDLNVFSLCESYYLFSHISHISAQKDYLNGHNTMIISIMQLFLCFYHNSANLLLLVLCFLRRIIMFFFIICWLLVSDWYTDILKRRKRQKEQIGNREIENKRKKMSLNKPSHGKLVQTESRANLVWAIPKCRQVSLKTKQVKFSFSVILKWY